MKIVIDDLIWVDILKSTKWLRDKLNLFSCRMVISVILFSLPICLSVYQSRYTDHSKRFLDRDPHHHVRVVMQEHDIIQPTEEEEIVLRDLSIRLSRFNACYCDIEYTICCILKVPDIFVFYNDFKRWNGEAANEIRKTIKKMHNEKQTTCDIQCIL